jgi:hypothetical protein
VVIQKIEAAICAMQSQLATTTTTSTTSAVSTTTTTTIPYEPICISWVLINNNPGGGDLDFTVIDCDGISDTVSVAVVETGCYWSAAPNNPARGTASPLGICVTTTTTTTIEGPTTTTTTTTSNPVANDTNITDRIGRDCIPIIPKFISASDFDYSYGETINQVVIVSLAGLTHSAYLYYDDMPAYEGQEIDVISGNFDFIMYYLWDDSEPLLYSDSFTFKVKCDGNANYSNTATFTIYVSACSPT